MTATDAAGLASLLDRSAVVVCCGSGGVGKTTTAAVLGLEAARRGRRVVVVTIDPARRLADALGLPDGLASEPQQIVLAAADGYQGELWAMMLDTATTFDGLVREHGADAEQIERILSNPLYRNMAGAMSGTQEYMAAETLYALDADERFDLVIVDTPPSRQALDFLDAPGVLSRFLDHRIFKLMMLPTRGGMKMLSSATQPILRAVGRIVGSEVLSDSVAFFQAFAGMETGFRERADEVMALLRSDTTAFVVVSTAQNDTVAEAVWFAEQLQDQGVGVSAAVVNRTQPSFGPVDLDSIDTDSIDADSIDGDSIDGDSIDGDSIDGDSIDEVDFDDAALGLLWANLVELRARRDAEVAVLAPLADAIGPDPVALVPLLDSDVHDLTGLETVGRYLFGRT